MVHRSSFVSRRSFLRASALVGAALLEAMLACSPSAPAAAPTAAPTSPAPAAASVAPAAKPSTAPVASPAAAAPQPAAKATNVKAAWVAQTANQMIWPLAKDAGYFDKEGVSFDLTYIQGSSTAIAALLARDLNVASVAGSAVVGAQAAGQDVVMVAGFLNQAVFRVMSRELQSIDDVKGKTVAVTAVGNADYFTWQTIIGLKHWGTDDVKFVNAKDVAGQVALLQQGSVQAIAVSPPNDVLAAQVGGHMILDTATLNEPEQNVGFATTRAYLTENRAAALGVVKASIEAMARWKKDPDFTKGVIKKYLPSDNPQFTEVGYSAYANVWPQAPYPSKEGFAKVIEQVSVQNPKAKDLKVDQLIDNSLVKELEDSGFIKQVYGG